MRNVRTLDEVARLTDPAEIADEIALQDKAQCRESQSSRLIYRETVDGNAARPLSESFGDDAASIVGKAEEFISALQSFRAANAIKARLDEMVIALAQCTRKAGYQYSYSMSELGDVLGCTHQTARERYKAYLQYEPDVKRIAESIGLAS